MKQPNQPVRKLRTFLGMTQAEFAERISTHKVYVSQIETGHQPLGHAVALRIASAFPVEMTRLGITVEDLLRGMRTNEGGEAA